MTDIYLCVVSHNDDNLVKRNFSNIQGLYGNYRVQLIVIDNMQSSALKEICEFANIKYFSDGQIRGYGANNNLGFSVLSPLPDESIFIVCNPDVTIQTASFEALIDDFINADADMYGVKVFESQDLSVVSSHSRKAPCLFDPLVSLLLGLKLFVLDPDERAEPDWIGGAFMMFRKESFEQLVGFDEKYFMYYEDADICLRAKKLGMLLVYNPEFHIVHEAKRKGRNPFSIHFIWNFKSMVRFFMRHPPRCFVGRNYVGR